MRKFKYNDIFRKNLMNYIGRNLIISNPTLRVNGKIIKVSNEWPYIRIKGYVKYKDGKIEDNIFSFSPLSFDNIEDQYQIIIR